MDHDMTRTADAAEDVANRAGAALQTTHGQVRYAVQGDAGGALEEISEFVSERPVLAMASAIGVGFVLGRVLR